MEAEGDHLCGCPLSRASGSRKDRTVFRESVGEVSDNPLSSFGEHQITVLSRFDTPAASRASSKSLGYLPGFSLYAESMHHSVRCGMVKVSDGKTRPTPMRLQLSMEILKLQKEESSPPNHNVRPTPSDSRVRIVGVTRQKVGGLGLSIKGGAEHKLPILISRIFKEQAADQTGQLFVGDAIIKVNGELITHCQHDEAVNILRNAGDIVMLTVKHYRAATPFLQKASE
ncbi:unnamed protein product [Nezara viridula]|uniref:PDZ domain-containing protein n=1 Tax=Nezara viridula TaxID=85310 RepID=A0A9P0HF42_NEZVI|nr:unnamed protein product [Nezara viridula]